MSPLSTCTEQSSLKRLSIGGEIKRRGSLRGMLVSSPDWFCKVLANVGDTVHSGIAWVAAFAARTGIFRHDGFCDVRAYCRPRCALVDETVGNLEPKRGAGMDIQETQ